MLANRLAAEFVGTLWLVLGGCGSAVLAAGVPEVGIGYAGVSLALLHGSQPDVIVVCHEPGRTQVLGHPGYALPSIEETIDLALRLGRRTNPAIRCGGVSLNTGRLAADEAQRLLASESQRLGCAVADPIRGGAAFDALVMACLA